MFQGLVLAITFGLLLTAVGWTFDTWQFWCFLGLFWCTDRMGRIQGRIEGIVNFLNMTEQEQLKLKQLLKDAGQR